MKVLSYHYDKEYRLWFRLFGHGLTIINRKKQPPRFSIRMGIEKEFRIGKYGIQILKS